MSESHYRKLERMYLSAPCNEYYLPRMSIEKGGAELVIPVKPAFFHSAGAVHGSVYFKALDDAAYFAVSSLVQEFFVLTASFTTYLIRPVTSGEIRAVGRVVFATPRLYLAESNLYDERDREIGRGSGNFVPGKVRLSSQVGYDEP